MEYDPRVPEYGVWFSARVLSYDKERAALKVRQGGRGGGSLDWGRVGLEVGAEPGAVVGQGAGGIQDTARGRGGGGGGGRVVGEGGGWAGGEGAPQPRKAKSGS